MRTSEKSNYCESIPLKNLLSEHHHLPLYNMAKNMVIGVGKKEISTISSKVYFKYWIESE